jgi:AcrR family transcriptional regulator
MRTRAVRAAVGRAVDAGSKSERRESIAAAAADLLRADPSAAFAVEELARRAGLAKGTVYLYFPSREAVLLEVHRRQMHALFDAFESALDAPGACARTVLEAGIRWHRERPEAYALAGNCRAWLAGEVDVDAAVAFKASIGPRIASIGARLEALLPGLAPGGGAALLTSSHALIIGLWQLADTPPRVARAMQRAGVERLRIDFEQQLIDALTDLWDGAARRAAGRRR